ncbi:MAG: methionine--tRNA ligase, partial [Candidatus Aenigmarchaeota archaeon]|nr:methionine--tRNA ligase [Candidatus Aenigmarchaeota archaeon]
KERCGAVINVCLGLSATIGKLLYPFLPSSSERLWKQLGFADDISKGGLDFALKSGQKLGEPKILFAKIEKDDVEKFKIEFSGKK